MINETLPDDIPDELPSIDSQLHHFTPVNAKRRDFDFKFAKGKPMVSLNPDDEFANPSPYNFLIISEEEKKESASLLEEANTHIKRKKLE